MHKETHVAHRNLNLSFFLASLAMLIFAITAFSQTKAPVDLYNEVDGYVQTRQRELLSQGKRLTREQMDALEGEKRSLAAKYANDLSTRTDLKKTDLFYLGMLYNRAGNGAKELETLKRFLAEFPSDQKGD